jgi:hypothetical protein
MVAMTATTSEQLERRRDAVLATYDDGPPGRRGALTILCCTTLALTDQRIWRHVQIEDVMWADGPAVVAIGWEDIIADAGWTGSESVLVRAAGALAGAKIDCDIAELIGSVDDKNFALILDALYVARGQERSQVWCRDEIGRRFRSHAGRLDEAVSA